MPPFEFGEILYFNPLKQLEDIRDFIAEGTLCCSFPAGRLRLESALDPALGQMANFLFWCPEYFSNGLAISWRFRPLREPGLAMFWLHASGRNGEDLFDPLLPRRDGQYNQYHSGAIDAYHLSYFRRKNPKGERSFHTCNLRKSFGFNLVQQGADPIPSVIDCKSDFRLCVISIDGWIHFSIDDLPILVWQDDGRCFGRLLDGGYIGFRQMAPLIAEYADLEVRPARFVR